MASNSDSTVSDAPVAARAQLTEGEGTGHQQNLERKANEQEALQAAQLEAGQVTGRAKAAAEKRQKIGEHDRASLRNTGSGEPGVQGGFVDNMSRRSDHDALEGHFVSIDLNHSDIDDELRESGGDYGVYLEPGDRDPKTGYPLTAVVRLRDSSNALVRVPYEALRPAVGGRR